MSIFIIIRPYCTDKAVFMLVDLTFPHFRLYFKYTKAFLINSAKGGCYILIISYSFCSVGIRVNGTFFRLFRAFFFDVYRVGLVHVAGWF